MKRNMQLRRPAAIALAALLATGGIGLAANALAAVFQGAGPGVAVTATSVPLPEVMPQRTGFATSASNGAFTPSLQELLNGEVVIETDAQMKTVWNRLFAVPYDASLFDFTSDFVILMGGGKMSIGSFSISSVERVTAEYNSFFFQETEDFLAATATTFLPGIAPHPLPPATFRVSAVRVSKDELDDAVFHRTLIAAP